MRLFILKRVLISIPMLLAISFLTFILMRLTPGNYLDTIRLDPQVSPETIAYYENLYKLNQPVLVQYLNWVGNLFKGELGFSFYFNIPVSKIIYDRLWNTFLLSFTSFLITWLVAIPLGVWAAVKRNCLTDKIIQAFSYIGLATPSFFIAILFLLAASLTGLLPLGGMYSADFDSLNPIQKFLDVAAHLVLPAIALSIGSIAGLQRIMRGNMLEVLGQQYILTARAKGLPENRVIYVHALKNAINPLITFLGYEFSGLLSGAALIEIMTSWPGLGSLMLNAVRAKDIYLVMASLLMGGVMFIMGNLLADILLAKIDPRIRYE